MATHWISEGGALELLLLPGPSAAQALQPTPTSSPTPTPNPNQVLQHLVPTLTLSLALTRTLNPTLTLPLTPTPTPNQVLQQLAQLTGSPAMPPLWAQGNPTPHTPIPSPSTNPYTSTLCTTPLTL